MVNFNLGQKTLLAGFFLLSSASAHAQQVERQNEASYGGEVSGINISVDTYIGFMRGESKELVYRNANTDDLLSELIWDFKNTLVLGGNIKIQPSDMFSVNLGAWKILGDNSEMDDFDYNIPGCPVGGTGTQCHSNHPNTEVDGFSFEASIEANLYKSDSLTLGVLAGYKRDHFEWVAIGGTSNYSPPFPDIPVISYEQDWSAPFLGVSGALSMGNLTLSGRAIGSLWVSATDRDIHHLRSTGGLQFDEDFGGGSKMIGLDMKAAYQMTDALSVFGALHYQNYFTTKGSTLVTDIDTGATAFFPGDAAGASHKSSIISMGMQYKF